MRCVGREGVMSDCDDGYYRVSVPREPCRLARFPLLAVSEAGIIVEV